MGKKPARMIPGVFTKEEHDAALEFYHRAMESNPPESMKQPLMERMDALFKKTGKKAPPLPGGK